jgi:integrase
LGYAEKRGTYWRGRYKIGLGRYGTVIDSSGATARFTTKRDAQNAANAAEAQIRAGTWRDPAAGRITFGEYASRWYQAQDLAASTMQNYRRHIEEHLLPAFEDTPITDILPTDVAAWEKRELAVPYAPSSVKTWRGTLHLILADAVEEGLRDSNPATRRRGRGKRAGRSRHRGPEKSVTNALGMLLIAERAALLSGRDDEFLAVILLGYTGIRWGELVGLEAAYVRDTQLRIEWQLYELDNGHLERCPPKDDSRRTIDLPDWLARMLAQHVARTDPKPCACHGQRYVFHGHGAANGAARQQGAKLVDVARRAGVSTGTVSNVLNRPDTVPETTRVKVSLAIEELGYVRGGAPRELAAHWRRTGFAAWLFHPAVTGWYPKRSPGEAHPVPLLGDPWPGIPVRGRNASRRAEACWLPIAPGLTPHGLRHTHKTLMEELRTPPKLMDERMGHEDGSVQARYSHITPDMRSRLMKGLSDQWERALDARRELSRRSPVAVLDELLVRDPRPR